MLQPDVDARPGPREKLILLQPIVNPLSASPPPPVLRWPAARVRPLPPLHREVEDDKEQLEE